MSSSIRRLRIAFGLPIAVMAVGCGQQPAEPSAATADSTLASIALSGQSPTTAEAKPSSTAEALQDDLARRVANAYMDRTMFPSSAIADYLLSNRAHRKLVIQCLQDAGFGEYGYDTSDAMIVPAMIDSFRIPLRWVAPPANFVPDREIPPGLRPSDPNAVGWVPPEMPADRLAAFEDAINVCENAPYPSSVDWKLAEGIDGEMIALADEATHSDGFVSLQKAFETCIETRGGKMSQESPAGEFMIDAANPVDGDTFDAQAVDSACRTDLYPAFIELKRDEWREWVDRREGDLKELADKWAQLEKEAGIG